MFTTQQTKQRPLVVTILAILAGIVGVVSVIHALQGLGILPFFIGSFKVRNFDLWYAISWGLMAWIYFWLVQMIWRMDKSAWLFMAVITVFNLILDFTTMLTSNATFSDVSVSFILNALILIYVMLPGTKRAFDVD
jgi:hypothetical protein